MLKTDEAYAELTQETLAPRLGAVLVGGCRPLVGTALKKLHPSELDISPRTTENIKSAPQRVSHPSPLGTHGRSQPSFRTHSR